MSTPESPRVESLEPRQLLSAGQLDTTFNSTGIINDVNQPVATGVAVGADGKVVVAGTNNGNFEITRYTATGQLDTTFGDGTGHVTSDFGGNDQVGGVVIQPDGKIVVAGTSNIGGQETSDVVIARYNVDGSLDHTFSHDGLTAAVFGGNGTANDVALESDGSILAVGTRIDTQTGVSDMLLVKFSSKGVIDANFGDAGEAFTGLGDNPVGNGLAIEPDGEIVVAGSEGTTGATSALLVKFTSGGAPENVQFTIDSDTHVDSFNSVVVQSNGDIVAAGRTGSQGVLARFFNTGSADTSFGDTDDGLVVSTEGAEGAAGGFTDVKQQSDGKLVAGGFADTASGFSFDFVVERFLASGTVDTSFGDSGITTTDFDDDDRINRIALQSDNAVLAAGSSGSHLAVARYQPDPPPLPTATLVSALRLHHAEASYTFVVDYHSGFDIDTTTIDGNDIIVTGPHGFSAHATVVSDLRGRNKATRVVTYAVTGPGGMFTAAGNGIYTFNVQANQVEDLKGLAVPAEKVGAFTVIIA